jgi:hypothetical protein
MESKTTFDLKVIPLKSAVADDLAAIILRAIAEGTIVPGSPGQTTTGGGGTPHQAARVFRAAFRAAFRAVFPAAFPAVFGAASPAALQPPGSNARANPIP